MEIKFPDFVWCVDKERLELDPQTESFVVEPQTNQGLKILRQNMVKVTSRSIYTFINYTGVERLLFDLLITLFQISRRDIDDVDNLDDTGSYPPRVFLEANARDFTCCSVSISNVQGCTFELTRPSGGVQQTTSSYHQS